MTARGQNSLPAIGFLTVREYAELGMIGAYLLLNPAGRPLEFHCTAPVRPDRAQQILYGATLYPYVYGEQIGSALVSRSKHEPLFICTDLAPVLALRPLVPHPVIHLLPYDDADDDRQAPTAPRNSDLPLRFRLGDYEAEVPRDSSEDCQRVQCAWSSLAADLDLHEPFQRIQEAIDEIQRSAQRAAA